MISEKLKIGDQAKAIFRKYGRHNIIGTVWEISTDGHGLDGTWVSMRVTGGDMTDGQVAYMVANRINVLLPIKDVKEIL